MADTETCDDADPDEIVDTDEVVDGPMLVAEKDNEDPDSGADGALALAFTLAELEVATEVLALEKEVVGE